MTRIDWPRLLWALLTVCLIVLIVWIVLLVVVALLTLVSGALT